MLLGSFYTGLSGLQANATALNVVGNNLANINTSGFKRGQANFAQIMSNSITGLSGGGNPIQVGLGVKNTEVVSNFGQGSIQTTGIKTHLALQGDGFFQVRIDGANAFTRSGNFSFDQQGFLVAANGGRVQGFVGTNPDGTVDNSGGLSDIQVDLGQSAPPKASELVRFISNLSAEAVTGDTYATSIEVFDSKGVPHQLTLTYTKTANPGEWTYDFQFNGDATNVSITRSDGTTVGPGGANGTIVFDGNGNLNTVDGQAINTGGVATPGFTEPTVTITGLPGAANDLTLAWDLVEEPTDPLTQPNGSLITNYGSQNNTGTLFQDGYGSGVLQDIDFDQDGTMVGFFSNGLSLELARVAVATFNNEIGLKQVDGGFYFATAASGPFSIDGEGTGGRGTIISSSLESSNVDIAEEFTSLIIHQRGYQSNSRIITTADQLLQEALNLKR